MIDYNECRPHESLDNMTPMEYRQKRKACWSFRKAKLPFAVLTVKAKMNALRAALPINPSNAIDGLKEQHELKQYKLLTNQSNYRLSKKGEGDTSVPNFLTHRCPNLSTRRHLFRHTEILRHICNDCLRHLRIFCGPLLLQYSLMWPLFFHIYTTCHTQCGWEILLYITFLLYINYISLNSRLVCDKDIVMSLSAST